MVAAAAEPTAASWVDMAEAMQPSFLPPAPLNSLNASIRGPLTAAGRRLAPLVASTDADGTLLFCKNGIDGVCAVKSSAALFVQLGVEKPDVPLGSAADFVLGVLHLPCADRSGELTRSERAKFFANSWRVRDEAIEDIARLRPP